MHSGHTADIPVLDISKSGTQIGEDLIAAAATFGFVFVKSEGTGFTSRQIERTFALSRKFFDSPHEVKEECVIDFKRGNNRGWSSMYSETLDPENQRRGDFKEAFNFGEFVDGKAQQPMPKTLVSNEEELSEFADSCHALCIKILELFALGLKVSRLGPKSPIGITDDAVLMQIDPQDGGEAWFSSRHDRSKGPSGSILRLLHYPAIPEGADYIPSIDIRAGAHSDYGSITLLFQQPNQPGLEILTPSNSWASVPATPAGTESDPFPPILINIGDLLSYWTNGFLKSTVHRVIFPSEARKGGEDRYSIAYFCHPVNDSKLEPVPSEVVRKQTAGRTPTAGAETMTAEEHLNSRLAATYESARAEKAMD